MDVNKRNIIIICTIIVLIVAAIVSIIFVNTALIARNGPKPNNVSDNKDIDDEADDEGDFNKKKKVCEGTYYGEYQTYLDDGQVSLDLKYTYILNSNNTYKANFGPSGNEGTYSINDDIIIFNHNGIEDKYEIADDCSYIVINDEDSDIHSFVLDRQ